MPNWTDHQKEEFDQRDWSRRKPRGKPSKLVRCQTLIAGEWVDGFVFADESGNPPADTETMRVVRE